MTDYTMDHRQKYAKLGKIAKSPATLPGRGHTVTGLPGVVTVSKAVEIVVDEERTLVDTILISGSIMIPSLVDLISGDPGDPGGPPPAVAR